MPISVDSPAAPMELSSSAAATHVRVTDTVLHITLADGRELGTPLSRFPWLAQATPAQRRRWHIEPHGFAVYWDDLDDGVEVNHLMV